MKTQKIVTEDNRDDWENKVNRFLEAGWLVVPGSMVTERIKSEVTNDFGSKFDCSYTVYTIILEKESIETL